MTKRRGEKRRVLTDLNDVVYLGIKNQEACRRRIPT